MLAFCIVAMFFLRIGDFVHRHADIRIFPLFKDMLDIERILCYQIDKNVVDAGNTHLLGSWVGSDVQFVPNPWILSDLYLELSSQFPGRLHVKCLFLFYHIYTRRPYSISSIQNTLENIL